jgi:hypothetical protein
LNNFRLFSVFARRRAQSTSFGHLAAGRDAVRLVNVDAAVRINLDSAVFMLQTWINALQGNPGAAVFASSVVARIGVANHEAIAAAKGELF